METNRQKIYNMSEKLYMYCRYNGKTHDMIRLIKDKFVSIDEEMIKFLDECLEDSYEAKHNKFFDDKSKWPNLTIKIEDDDSLMKIDEFISHIPFLITYMDYI